VEADGDVYVVYWFGGRFNCARSIDGGATFGTPTYPFGAAFGSASIASPQPNQSHRVNPFPNIETDPTRPSHVYVIGSDDDDTPVAADASNVFFARSTDDGATWGARIKLNDDGLTRNQYWPWIAVNEKGHIAAMWYDTRNDAGNHLLDVYCAMSFDGGATFTPNMRVTDTNFEPNTGQFGGNGFLGDYNGMSTAGNKFHLVWTDTRRPGQTNEQEIYYDRKTNFQIALQCPPPTVNVCAGQPVNLQACITNQLSVPDTFCVTIVDGSGACPGFQQVIVPSGGTVCVPYNCIAPAAFVGASYPVQFQVASCSDPSWVESCLTNVNVSGATASVSCAPDQGTDHRYDLTLQYCVTNNSNCPDQFNYSLSDQKGWIIATDQPPVGSVNLNPGNSFCINATVHTPINCTAGETSVVSWGASPQNNPAGGAACQTTVTCVSPTATMISGFTGQAGTDYVELEYTLPDEGGLQGVNVYRAPTGTNDFARVNPALIPVDGRGTYRFTDRSVTAGGTYTYELGLVEGDGTEVRLGRFTVRTGRAVFALAKPYPNPTAAGFTLKANTPRDGRAVLRVFDVNGRVMSVIHDGLLPAGEHTFTWDGMVQGGRKAHSGIYFVTLEASGRKASERVIVME
jgi:hypothetical protein